MRRASKDGRADASNLVGMSAPPQREVLLLMLQMTWLKVLKCTLGSECGKEWASEGAV